MADVAPWSDALLRSGHAMVVAAERVLRDSPEDSESILEVAALIQAHPDKGRPSAAWRKRAAAVTTQLADAPTLACALLDCTIDASIVDERGWIDGGAELATLGIVRIAAEISSPEVVDRLAHLARVAPNERIIMACAGAMADPLVPRAATALLALERNTRHGLVLIEIRKAIDTIAAATGQTREEFEERSVERHGLDAAGRRTIALANGSLELSVDARAPTLRYLTADGKARASIPPAVREQEADAVAAARAEVKALKTTIAGERARLDALMASVSSWPVDTWRERYLDHPITGRMARACIWVFRAPDGAAVSGIPQDDGALGLVDGTTASTPADAIVTLWHPILAPSAEVGAWRQRLIDDGVVQPVKQAFREVYVLTPAEIGTGTYSNRFAGHVFKQVQARALFRRRGWKSTALAWWDDGNDHGVASRAVPGHALTVEFLYDPIEDLDPDGGELYPLCVSDQMRFVDAASGEAIPLAEVGPVAFSEAMRDVDLAVAVTSIGADLEWHDRGLARDHPGRFDGYWEGFTTGPLGAAAQVRREVLAGLLPALAISDRCELEERSLVVRGDLTTYRIHLGTGNVRMDPDDQYLCIVSARDARAKRLFLPFDDDRTLSLILSKAFLLAADAEIDDPLIVGQIRGSR